MTTNTQEGLTPYNLRVVAADMEVALEWIGNLREPYRTPIVDAIQNVVADRLRELIDPPVKVKGVAQPASELVLGRVTSRVRETVDAMPVGSQFTDKMSDRWEVVAEGLLKITFKGTGNTSRMFTVEAFDRWPWSLSEITITKVGA